MAKLCIMRDFLSIIYIQIISFGMVKVVLGTKLQMDAILFKYQLGQKLLLKRQFEYASNLIL